VSIVLKSGILNLLELSGPVKTWNGLHYLYRRILMGNPGERALRKKYHRTVGQSRNKWVVKLVNGHKCISILSDNGLLYWISGILDSDTIDLSV
jgi:hypothetical protein